MSLTGSALTHLYIERG